MGEKPNTTKDTLQTELNSVLAAVEGKMDPETAQKIKQAMDKLLAQDNKFNREMLITTVDELLIIGDSKELHKEQIKKILKFLDSLKDFLATGLKSLYEYDNTLKEEQRKIKDRIADLQETQRMRMGK